MNLNINEKLANAKEKLLELKEKRDAKRYTTLENKKTKRKPVYIKEIKNIILNKYIENNNINIYLEVKELEELIEKVAEWYEIRYPEELTNEIINFNQLEEISTKDITQGLPKEIINILNTKEQLLVNNKAEEAANNLYVSNENPIIVLSISNNGIIKTSKNIKEYTNSKIKDENIIGKTIEELLKLFEDENIAFPDKNKIISIKNEIDRKNNKEIKQTKRLLDCIMLTIIEKGGKRIGPKRALIFAKEYNRNIKVPLKYGIDKRDVNLNNFIESYLAIGGNININCYEGYFNNKLNTRSLLEIYKIETEKQYKKNNRN